MELTDSALRALAKMRKAQRRFVVQGIKIHLSDNDPAEVTRNKFPLRRPSAQAERELRLDDWRVFYTVMEEGQRVLINLIGEKRGDKLFIEGEEFEL